MPNAIPTIDRVLPGYGGDVVAITAQITLQPNDSVDVSADALRNVFGERVNLDSFRWTADAQVETAGTADPPTSPVGFPGAGISTSLKLGDKPLTAGEIPLYLLGRAVGQDVEHTVLGVADSVNTEFYLGAYASGVWDFDHPLTLEEGDSFSVHLTHRGLLKVPVVVTLALTGRSGKDLPYSRWFPYAAAWLPAALDPTAPTATIPAVVTSTERDLINATGRPLYVSRFIGRLLRLSVTGAPLGGSSILQNADAVSPTVPGALGMQPPADWYPGAVDSFLAMTLRDSRSNDNVPKAIQFRTIFEPETRSFECPHVLDPLAYYIAQLTLSVPTTTTDASIQPAVAMIGAWEGR